MSHRVGQLAKKYDLFQDVSTVVVFIGLTLIFMFSHKFETTVIAQDEVAIEVIVEKVAVTKQIQKAVKPTTSKIPIAAEDDEELEDEGEALLFESTEFDIADAPPPPPPPTEVIDQVVEFWAIEEKPQIIGGTSAIYKYLVYPKMAKRSGVEGFATLKFVCSSKGVPVKIRILQERPKNMGFGEAAKLAFSRVRLTPGMQRDKPVAVNMTQRITFNLK